MTLTFCKIKCPHTLENCSTLSTILSFNFSVTVCALSLHFGNSNILTTAHTDSNCFKDGQFLFIWGNILYFLSDNNVFFSHIKNKSTPLAKLEKKRRGFCTAKHQSTICTYLQAFGNFLCKVKHIRVYYTMRATVKKMSHTQEYMIYIQFLTALQYCLTVFTIVQYALDMCLKLNVCLCQICYIVELGFQ